MRWAAAIAVGPFVVALVALVAVAAVVACGDLKSANEVDDAATGAGDATAVTDGGVGADGPDGAAASDGGGISDGAFPDGKGPGPHGSLPTGYCCNADTECRYRHCVDTGGGAKMCLDECQQNVFCTRPDITFTCEPSGSPRLCKPSPGFTCLPAAGFTRGTKTLGACCNAGPSASNDGTAGSECEGNQCASVGSGPFVCTHRCEFQSDCSGGDFACLQFGSSKACIPGASGDPCF